MEIGIDSFAATIPNPATGELVSPADRIAALLNEVETADRVGLDVFGIGEHHRKEFLDSAPTVLLAAAAARTKTIKLASAVTVLSAADPVRTFQEFATIDLISKGRAEIVVGRGSFGEAYPLFGFTFEDYDALFAEKLDLLLQLRDRTEITWNGRFRPALTGQGVYPRPHQAQLPVWLGVGGTPQSFVRAGTLGLPLMVAIIGGSFDRFRPLVDLYRDRRSRRRSCPRNPARRYPRDGLRRRYGRGGARRLLPRLGAYVHRNRPRTRLATRYPCQVRRNVRPAWRVSDRQPPNGPRQDQVRQRNPRGHFTPDLPDELGDAGTRRDATVD